MNIRDDLAVRELNQSLNMEPLWMPFTPNRQFKSAPRLITGARDMHYTTDDGRMVLDGVSGLWCVNAGHCRQPIVDAIRKQAETMDYVTAFNMSHPTVFQAAEMVTSGISR